MGLEHLILKLLKTRRGRIIVSLLAVALSSFFGMFAWPNVADARKLRQRHEFCKGKVTDHRYTRGAHFFDGSYDLRYAFRISPNGRLYQQCEKGPLARVDLWTPMAKSKWLEAVNSGKVDVAYYPDDPTINAVRDDLDSNCRTLIGFSIVSAVMMLASAVWFIVLIAPRVDTLPLSARRVIPERP